MRVESQISHFATTQVSPGLKTRSSTVIINLNSFLRDETGAELAEYAVGVAIVVAIAVIVYQVLGDAINNKMISVASEIDAPPAPATP